jgi:hypothetical protein
MPRYSRVNISRRTTWRRERERADYIYIGIHHGGTS